MTKLIQEHMLLTQQCPNRELPTYYRDSEMFFDPGRTPVYQTPKQVIWRE